MPQFVSMSAWSCRNAWSPRNSGSKPARRNSASKVLPVLCSLLLLLVPVLAPVASAGVPGQLAEEEEVFLTSEAAELNLRQGRRKTTAGSLAEKLPTAVRAALNDWAEVVAQYQLSVVLPKGAEVLVLGRADSGVMTHAAEVLDDAWEMLADIQQEDGPAVPATLVFLFDKDSMGGEAWEGVLNALVERNQLVAFAARSMTEDPGPLMLRGLPGFLQPTYDMAGNAAAGDDEFRLDNELAHKLAQCVLKSRFGEVPTSIRWGMGFLVEQRQYRSIYQLNATGFVAAVDHFDWPKKARSAVLDAAKSKSWSIAQLASRDDSAGRATEPQMITWGALDYLYKKDTPALVGMLSELAQLHADGAGWRTSSSEYLGDEEATVEVLAKALDGIDGRKLASHLKKVK